MSSFTPFLLSPALILHYNCLHLLYQRCLFSAHMVWWFLWNSNLYYTAAPNNWSEKQSVGCHYRAKCRPNPEWLELRTTSHVVWGYARRNKRTLTSTIVAKVMAWIHQWAAELQKRQIALTYWSQALVAWVHHTTAWILDTWSWLENSTLHTSSLYHTHVHSSQSLSTLVRTSHAHSELG